MYLFPVLLRFVCASTSVIHGVSPHFSRMTFLSYPNPQSIVTYFVCLSMTCGCSSASITEGSTVVPLLSPCIKQLIVLRLLTFLLKSPIPFLVPIILSVHIPLGLRFSPVSLDAPLTHHGRSYIRFLLNHTDSELTPPYISIWPTFRPVHSRFSSVLPHILTIGIL